MKLLLFRLSVPVLLLLSGNHLVAGSSNFDGEHISTKEEHAGQESLSGFSLEQAAARFTQSDFPCPLSASIMPCTCLSDSSGNIYLNCPAHVTEEELANVFQQDFPVKLIYRFRIDYNNELTALRNILNGVTIEFIELTPGPFALGSISDYFLLDIKDTLFRLEIIDSQLTSDFFPFIVFPQLEQLEYLKISGSSLTFILPLNAPKLTTLYLTNGLTEILEKGTIPIHPGKTLLYLTDNRLLHTVEPGCFFFADQASVNSSEKVFIDLSFNELKSLQAGTFPIRNGLLDVRLNSNQITSIEPGTFVLPETAGTTDSQSLVVDISDNQLQSLQAGTFPIPIGEVDFLLYMNRINSIEPGTFFLLEGAANSTSDFHLTIRDNDIQSLQAGTFPLRNARMELYLYDNLISYIEPGAFVLPQTKDSLDIVLYLHGNQLSTLDELVFGEMMPYISSFRIHTNPLVCGCDIAWLVVNATYIGKVDDAATCVDGTRVRDLNPTTYQDFC